MYLSRLYPVFHSSLLEPYTDPSEFHPHSSPLPFQLPDDPSLHIHSISIAEKSVIATIILFIGKIPLSPKTHGFPFLTSPLLSTRLLTIFIAVILMLLIPIPLFLINLFHFIILRLQLLPSRFLLTFPLTLQTLVPRRRRPLFASLLPLRALPRLHSYVRD